MKKFLISFLVFLFFVVAFQVATATSWAASSSGGGFGGLTNPVIGDLGGNTADSRIAADSGALFLLQFVSWWRNAINLGAILLIIYYIWGGIEWITAGGDSGKLEKARNRLMQATIGMMVLAFSFIIIGFISYGVFGESFDLLKLEFITPDSAP